MTDLASLLVERLADGRWAKIDHLARDLQTNRREIEAAIQEARLAGHPLVGSSLRGIRLSSDPDEVLAYVDDRQERLVSIYLGTRALRRAARKMREQVDLTLFGPAA